MRMTKSHAFSPLDLFSSLRRRITDIFNAILTFAFCFSTAFSALQSTQFHRFYIWLSTLSGNYPIFYFAQMLLIGLAALIVGKKTEYNFTYMWLSGVISFLFFSLLSIILAKISTHIPWIRTVLLWPAN